MHIHFRSFVRVKKNILNRANDNDIVKEKTMESF